MLQRKLTFYAFNGLLISSVLLKKMLPIFVIVLVFVWLWERDFYNKWNTLKKHKIFLFLPVYFFCLSLGMLYSENIAYGLQKMETRLSLFLLPVILPTLKSLNFSYYKRIFTRVFTTTIFIAFAICLARAAYLYFTELLALNSNNPPDIVHGSRYFYGTFFSYFLMHPGYLAMYVNVALLIILADFKKNYASRKSYLHILYIILLSIFVILLYSKAAIAVVILMLLIFGIRYAFFERKLKYMVITIGAVASLCLLFYFFVPHTKTRIQHIFDSFSEQKHDPSSMESTQLRIHAWKAAKSLISQSPLIGYGTGDVWDVLSQEYKTKGFTGALAKEVNSHNEYYQTGLALGILGICVLVLTLIYWFLIALKKKHFPLMVWTLMTAFVLFFESYFSTQDGVIFSSLFLFFVYALQNDSHA
jgi:O-antigen ligase